MVMTHQVKKIFQRLLLKWTNSRNYVKRRRKSKKPLKKMLVR
jgi:hypothetical protein